MFAARGSCSLPARMLSPSGRGGSGAAGLFVISAAILTLEVLQTRLFSYCLSPLLIYAAVGVALLGLGASGTALSLWEGWRRYSLGSIGAWASAGFSASLIGAHVLFAYSSRD